MCFLEDLSQPDVIFINEIEWDLQHVSRPPICLPSPPSNPSRNCVPPQPVESFVNFQLLNCQVWVWKKTARCSALCQIPKQAQRGLRQFFFFTPVRICAFLQSAKTRPRVSSFPKTGRNILSWVLIMSEPPFCGAIFVAFGRSLFLCENIPSICRLFPSVPCDRNVILRHKDFSVSHTNNCLLLRGTRAEINPRVNFRSCSSSSFPLIFLSVFGTHTQARTFTHVHTYTHVRTHPHARTRNLSTASLRFIPKFRTLHIYEQYSKDFGQSFSHISM